MKKYKKLTTEQMGVSKKRFKKLLEYSYINNEDDLLLDEEDDESQENTDDQPMQQDTDNQDIEGEEISQDAMGGEEGGEDMMGDTQDMADDQSMDMGDNQDMGMDGSDEMMGDIEGDDTTDEVEIDVTDLTDKQDDVDSKVTALSKQTEMLLNTLIQLSDRIEIMSKKSDNESQLIRKEIEKRNPTPVEKLQKRIVVSDPFNETPEDYWRKKEAEGDYKLVDDEEEEFTITPSDLGGGANEIYKSLGFTDDEFNQNLESMFRM